MRALSSPECKNILRIDGGYPGGVNYTGIQGETMLSTDRLNYYLEDLDIENLRLVSNQLTAYKRGKMLISAVNVFLLVYLFATYADMYRQTKAGFTLGMVFPSGALLSYSLFTNPVLMTVSGGSGGIRIVRYFTFYLICSRRWQAPY